jgi:hypothetical protein
MTTRFVRVPTNSTVTDTSPPSVMLICTPYMERRAFATARKPWPELDMVCASAALPLEDYVRDIIRNAQPR